MLAPPQASDSGKRSELAAWGGIVGVYLVHVAYYYAIIGFDIVDDAFIYFRYAHNLASGRGLVYNPGEAVEGYTGFTWVLSLAAADWLGVPLIPFAQAAGVLLGACSLWLCFGLGQQLLRSRAGALLPVLFLATNRTFCVWSIEGLETKLFGTLLLACCAAWIARESPARGGRFPWLGVSAGCLALTRPEGLLFAGLGGLFIGVRALRAGRGRDLVPEAAAFLALTGAHLLFRMLYYGELLPNTFYAKVTGFQPQIGLRYLSAFVRENHVLYYAPLPLLGALSFAGAHAWQALRRWALLALSLYASYVVSIGGDYFEFRFLDPVLPIWAWLSVCGALAVCARIRHRALSAAALLVTTALWLSGNAQGVLQPPTDSLTRTTPEAEVHYTKAFAAAARWLALNLEPNDLIAIRPAGVIAYLSGARCLDILGLNDREIARGTRSTLAAGQSIGHQRLATREYLIERGVTYFIGHPDISPWPARPGRGHVSVEIEPGRFLIMHRLDARARFQDRIYRLSEHRGSLAGWTPAR